MKVVQINCSSSGSTGNIAKVIHQELLAMGHQSYIFFGIGHFTANNMFRIGNFFDLHCHSILSRNFGKQGYFSHIATLGLIRKLKRLNPDIIHLHNLHGNYLNLAMLFHYLKESNVQIVITLHDCWLFTGKCPHFTVAACERWKKSCGRCPQLSVYPRSKIDTTEKCLRDKKEWLSGFGDRVKIIAVSNWLRDIARQSYLSQYSIETIYNGINCDIFRPQDSSRVKRKYALENKFVILGVSSNWNEQKGLGEFLALSKELLDDEIIVLVGVTEKQMASIPANIIGITRTENQQELAELYSAADVFVNPSKEETFGLVTAEAMACGTPVIVYDSTACAEIVDDDCGYARFEDQCSLKSYINIVQNNKKDYYSLFCWNKVRENYNQRVMVRNYLELYGK